MTDENTTITTDAASPAHEHTELEGLLMQRLHDAHDKIQMLSVTDYILRGALKMLLAKDKTVTVQLPEDQNTLSKDDGTTMSSVTLYWNGKNIDIKE